MKNKDEYEMRKDINKTIQLPQGEKGDFVVSKGLNGVLFIFSENDWEQFDQWLFNNIPLTSKEARTFTRLFRGSAITCELESDGKWSIPDGYWEYLTWKKESRTVEVFNVEEYLDMRKENISEMEKTVLKHVAFVIVMSEEL